MASIDFGTCEHCRETYGYQLVHSVAADIEYAYCDTCGGPALLSRKTWDKYAPGLAPEPPGRISQSVEPFLRHCLCGGHFVANAAPRCPTCWKEISPESVRDRIERNAPGTALGWRWQGNWSGPYAFVVHEPMSERDPWASAPPPRPRRPG